LARHRFDGIRLGGQGAPFLYELRIALEGFGRASLLKDLAGKLTIATVAKTDSDLQKQSGDHTRSGDHVPKN
jgi:hypothetical protein